MSERCEHHFVAEMYGATCEKCDRYLDTDELLMRADFYEAHINERDRYKAERDALQAEVAELKEENDHLQDCWFRDETICPDGSLRPKVSDLLNRIAKLEAYVAELEAEKRGEK